MNPVTFLLAAAILVALDAGWVSWLLYGVAFFAALIGRTLAILAAEGAQPKDQ